MWPLWIMTGLSGVAGYLSGIFSSSSVTPATPNTQQSCVTTLMQNGQTSDAAAQMCYGIKSPSTIDSFMLPLVVLGGIASIPLIMKFVQKKKSEAKLTVVPAAGWRY